MSTLFGHGHGGGGGGHHHGGGGGRFAGTPWGGWGYWGDPYAYAPNYDVDLFEEVVDEDGNVFMAPIQRVTVLGATDTGKWADQMNTLKQVPVSVARVLVAGGVAAIEHAQGLAKQPWYRPDLPGETTRANVAAKLKTHDDALRAAKDQLAIYNAGDDLKNAVLRAYLEENAAEEGAGQAQLAWNQLWVDVGRAIAALPTQVAQQVNQTAGALLGLPTATVVVGALVVGAVGLGIYAFAKGAR